MKISCLVTLLKEIPANVVELWLVSTASAKPGRNARTVAVEVAENILTECIVRSAVMITVDCIQGSEEWFEARLGMVTASNFGKVLAKGQGKTRSLYMYKLVAERLTGLREEGYHDKNMDNGQVVEDEARAYYETAYDCKVDQVGFVKRDDWIGGSPDGLIGTDGIIEIKCPLSSTHIANILSNKMPSEYRAQVQGLLWVTERQWCDFVSYDPRMVARPMQVVCVERDNDYIVNLAAQVSVFVKELKEIIQKIDVGF